jgi:hypothetical protein
MVAMPDNRLLLGAASSVFEVTLDGSFRKLRDLDSTINITGMARAPTGGLWILDGAGLRLIELSPEL